MAERMKNVLGHAERTHKSQTGTLTHIRVLVLQKRLISRRQGIPSDHRGTFLWAAKTLHGAHLN